MQVRRAHTRPATHTHLQTHPPASLPCPAWPLPRSRPGPRPPALAPGGSRPTPAWLLLAAAACLCCCCPRACCNSPAPRPCWGVLALRGWGASGSQGQDAWGSGLGASASAHHRKGAPQSPAEAAGSSWSSVSRHQSNRSRAHGLSIHAQGCRGVCVCRSACSLCCTPPPAATNNTC